MTHPSVPSALVARDLVKTYAARTVLDGVDLVAPPGRVVAVIGENGSGKSTLLRLLAGVDQPDRGSIQRPTDLAHLAQELDVAPTTTVGEVLDEALRPLHDAVARLEELAGRLDDACAATAYAELLEWAVLHDAWDASRRAEEAAHRLGLDDVAHDRPMSSLSGGQRSRLALAAVLTRRPGCLLLDEPTNHLDDEALDYLEQTLRDLPGIAVVASHDRVFLDNVADQVVDLDAGHFGSDGSGGRVHGLTDGGYSAVLTERRAAHRRWVEAFAEQQDERDRLRAVAAGSARQVAHNRPPRDNDKFIYHGKGEKVARTVRRRVSDAERRLEVLEREGVPKPPEPMRFSGVLAARGGAAVHVRSLEVPGRLYVDRLDVAAGEQLLVSGPNGCGKSTLLKVLAGRISARGTVDVRARRVGYLPQDVRFGNPLAPAAKVYAAATTDPEAPALRSLGLLHPRDVHRPVGELSVGQQRRLALAVLVARQPDLVLLDEPTNHISLALAEELEEALQRSVGTVVVASHDRWLRRRWTGPTLPLPSRH